MTAHLYIPVETAARELDAKLLLSLFAADHGVSVVLGNRALLSNRIHRFEPGVFLTHNFDRGRRRILRIVRDLGHTVVGWDEEGLVWISPDVYRRRRVHPDTVRLVDTIFAWGDEHAAALAPTTGSAGVAVMASGNPRADLLRPALRALYTEREAALREEFGPFILINSNFGWLNYALGRGGPSPREDDLPERARRSGHPEAFLRFRLQIFRAFVDVLPKLAARHPDRNIVIRPHPSEDPSAWEQAAQGLPNVSVRYTDELVPWLLAADAMVHNGCTTAVEAALLGRVPVMYAPLDGGEFESPQPRAISVLVRTEEELLHRVGEPASAAEAAATRGRVAGMVANADGVFAAEIIAGEIASRADDLSPGRPILGQFRARLRSLEKSFSRFARTSPSNPDYIARKFPPTPASSIADRLGSLASLLERPAPRVRELSDRIYLIESPGT